MNTWPDGTPRSQHNAFTVTARPAAEEVNPRGTAYFGTKKPKRDVLPKHNGTTSINTERKKEKRVNPND